MITVEDYLKEEQPDKYEKLNQQRSKLTLFFLWIDSKLDKPVQKLLEVRKWISRLS